VAAAVSLLGELHLALHQQICQTSSDGTRPFSLHCEALSLKAFGCPIQSEIKTAISMAAFPMVEGFFMLTHIMSFAM